MNKTNGENEILLPADHADKLLACADGRSALLYLHILRTGTYSKTAAARDLRCSEDEICRAADTLHRMGLNPRGQALPAADEIPEYSARDIAQRAMHDSTFEALLQEVQSVLGKLLSTNDIRLLFGIYDHLGLPADVICLLFHHCVETFRAANGDGRMPTMRYVEKEAWFWANNEILTLDAGEEHIRREKLRQEAAQQVKEILQIRGRALSTGERSYIEGWLSLGFSPESLAIAYDRTILGAGRLVWKYMDRIVRDWASKGLFTPDDIQRGDARYDRREHSDSPAVNPDPGAAADGVSPEIANMRKLYDSMMKGT